MSEPTVDDCKALRAALSRMGYATGESLEAFCLDWLRHTRTLIRAVDDLWSRVGFVESKVDIEDMPDEYGWAVNELTRRRAYSKAEVATVLAEQRRLALGKPLPRAPKVST